MTTTAQAIGALTAQVEALNQRLDRDRTDRATADAEAARARKELYRKVSEIENAHQIMLRRVDDIEPVAKMVTGWRAMVTGVMLVLGVIGSIVIGGLTYFKDAILRLLGF